MAVEERKIRYRSSGGQSISSESAWEQWFGDSGTRTVHTGRVALSFRKQFADDLEELRKEIRSGYESKRSAKEERELEARRDAIGSRKRARHLADLGRQSLLASRQLKYRSQKDKTFGSDIELEESDEYSATDEADDDEENEEGGGEDEDWKIKNMSKAEIESSMSVLLNQVRHSSQLQRRRIATFMMTRLLQTHAVARDHLDLIIPSLAEKAFFVTPPGTPRGAEMMRLGHFIAAVAEFLPERLSRYGCARKVSRLLTRKVHLAARIIQCFWRKRLFERKARMRMKEIHARKPHSVVNDKVELIQRECEKEEAEAQARARAMNQFLQTDLQRQWRRFVVLQVGELTSNEIVSMLRLLNKLCCKKMNPFFSTKDCRMIVEQGSVHALKELCCSKVQEIRSLATELLEKISSVPALRTDLVRAGAQIALGVLLQSELVEDRFLALEVLDNLARVVVAGKDCIHVQVWEMLENQFEKKQHETKEIAPFDFELSPGALRNPLPLREIGSGSGIGPEGRLKEMVELLVDRARDGGLLRWIKAILREGDGSLRIGATMVLLKLGSSPCNPFLTCSWEQCTLPERQVDSYEKVRSERSFLFLHQIILNVAELHLPELSIASLQLFAQLAACRVSRTTILTLSVPEQIKTLLLRAEIGAHDQVFLRGTEVHERRVNLLIRGLLLMILLCGTSEYPVHRSQELGEEDPFQDLLARSTVQVENAEKDESTVVGEHHIFRQVLDLELESTEKDLAKCLQNCLLALFSQKPAQKAAEAIDRLLFEFNGIDFVVEFFLEGCESARLSLFPSDSRSGYSETQSERDFVEAIEQLCVAPLAFEKICRVLPRAASSFRKENIIEALSLILRVAYQLPNKLPHGLVDLVYASACSSCFALRSIATWENDLESRLLVGECLLANDSVRRLASIVSTCSKAKSPGVLLENLAVEAAKLLGSMVPWQGLQLEVVSDHLSKTEAGEPGAMDERESWEKFLATDPSADAKREYLLQRRAFQNAKLAADQGLQAPDADIPSMFNTDRESHLVRHLVETAGQRLTRALYRTKDELLRDALCYALGRFCSTTRFASWLLSFGIAPVLCRLLQRPRDAMEGIDNEEEQEIDEGETSELLLSEDEARPVRRERRRAKRKVPKSLTQLQQLRITKNVSDYPLTKLSLCANVARPLQGKLEVISMGVVGRVLEIICDEETSTAALKLKGEAVLVLARVINMSHPIEGSVNERVLSYPRAAEALLDLCKRRRELRRVQLNAVTAVAQLLQDALRSVPTLQRAGAGSFFVRLLKVTEKELVGDPTEPKPVHENDSGENGEEKEHIEAVLRQTLRILKALSLYKLGELHNVLISSGIEPILRRLSKYSSTSAASSTTTKSKGQQERSCLQPLSEMSRFILDELRVTIDHGLHAKRHIATAPSNDMPEFLKDEALFGEKRPIAGTPSTGELFMLDPFGHQNIRRAHLRYSTSRECLVRLEPPSSAIPFLQSDSRKTTSRLAARTGTGHAGRRRKGNRDKVHKQSSLLQNSLPSELSFSHVVEAPESVEQVCEKVTDLLCTRPQHNKTISTEEMKRMSQAFLLTTRPPPKKNLRSQS